jgi:hypothetical protein
MAIPKFFKNLFNKQDPAKELFLKYDCNKFYMMKEGEEELYLNLGGGDPQKEAQWRKEYIETWLSRLNKDDVNVLHRLMNTGAGEAIPVILDLGDYGDDFMKYWFAYTLVDLSSDPNIENKLRNEARKKARKLWIEVLQSPVGINKEHHDQMIGSRQDPLNEVDLEKRLQDSIRHQLKETKWTRDLNKDEIYSIDSLWRL